MFNIGPSPNSGMMDRIKQKSRGNTGVTGGMRRGPIMRRDQGMAGGNMRPPMRRPSSDIPFGMGPMPQMGQPPVSTTMPVGRPRPNIIPMPDSMPPGMGSGMVQQPGQQPIEENQLWRTYNRLLGGPMAPRMLL